MNLSDVNERRKLAALILKQRTTNSHGFQHHHHLRHMDEGQNEPQEEKDHDEFIDSIRHHHHQQQQQVTAAPSNRMERHMAGSANIFHPHHMLPKQATQSEHQCLLIDQSEQQKFHRTMNSNHQRQALNSVIQRSESDTLASAAQARPIEQPAPSRPSLLLVHPNKPKNRPGLAVACENGLDDLGQLASQVKRSLSLPNDTSIPKSFFFKHKNRLNEFKGNERAPLNRIHRRQSLFDIGFGKATTYSKLHVLGAGTYSIVYKGASRLTSKLVALKEIHLEREEGVPFTAIREVSLLKQLKHCNIITLHDIIYTPKTLTLVFEYVDRDLSRYMDECDHKINLNNVRIYLFQLLRALKYCHDRKVLHRDIKPQNILISGLGELKLADFGLARAKSFPTKSYTDEVVTLWYRPPDVLLGNVDYGTSIDMWGVGCIFFEMVAGFTLFSGSDPKKQISCIFEILGMPDEVAWPSIKQDLKHNQFDIPDYPGCSLTFMAPRLDEPSAHLLSMLLRCNPKQRITSGEALRHNYFSSFPPKIYELHDSASIFSIATIKLTKELWRKNLAQAPISECLA